MTGSAKRRRLRGPAFGLAAAALFGISSPLAKLLLPASGPLLLAGLLYLGGGLGLLALGWLPGSSAREARLRRADVAPLVGIVLTRGVIGPVLMLVGLSRLSAVAAALLLNLEAPFTIAVALLLFGEHVERREGAAAAVIVAGAAAIGFRPAPVNPDALGVAAIAGACLSWGIDNNLTRLSLRDPLALVRVKTLGSGACTLGLALLTGHELPGPGVLLPALALGFMSYGISIVLDAYALRELGAAREAAYFATAPFMGALAAVPLLGERFTAWDAAASLAMAGGVALMLRARHAHAHAHEALEHDHLHLHDEHDEHHQHPHRPDDPPGEPHAHPHRHQPLLHDHAHVSALHHLHKH